MKSGDYVEIKEARSAGIWRWTDIVGRSRKGHITAADEHCFTVRTDDGETIRDVRDHFRPTQGER